MKGKCWKSRMKGQRQIADRRGKWNYKHSHCEVHRLAGSSLINTQTISLLIPTFFLFFLAQVQKRLLTGLFFFFLHYNGAGGWRHLSMPSIVSCLLWGNSIKCGRFDALCWIFSFVTPAVRRWLDWQLRKVILAVHRLERAQSQLFWGGWCYLQRRNVKGQWKCPKRLENGSSGATERKIYGQTGRSGQIRV